MLIEYADEPAGAVEVVSVPHVPAGSVAVSVMENH